MQVFGPVEKYFGKGLEGRMLRNDPLFRKFFIE